MSPGGLHAQCIGTFLDVNYPVTLQTDLNSFLTSSTGLSTAYSDLGSVLAVVLGNTTIILAAAQSVGGSSAQLGGMTTQLNTLNSAFTNLPAVE
jgi:hypothetical protein